MLYGRGGVIEYVGMKFIDVVKMSFVVLMNGYGEIKKKRCCGLIVIIK